MASQPAGMINDHGVILTIGFVQNNDRMSLVIPICTDDASMDDVVRCADACTSFGTGLRTAMLGCMSDELEMTYAAAEGMVDGIIPDRVDYTAGTYMGTLGSGSFPSNVTGLITFYEDPSDITPGDKMRTSHAFMPGPSPDHVVGDKPDAALLSVYSTLGQAMKEGWASANVPAKKWYRILSAPWNLTPNPDPPPDEIRVRPRGTTIKRIVAWSARGYVSTQRRRLVPHQ